MCESKIGMINAQERKSNIKILKKQKLNVLGNFLNSPEYMSLVLYSDTHKRWKNPKNRNKIQTEKFYISKQKNLQNL